MKQAHRVLMVQYVNNIIAFDAFANDKMLVYIEDGLNSIKEISDFLEVPEIPREPFQLTFQYENQSAEQQEKIDDLYKSRLGELYKYIERYNAQE